MANKLDEARERIDEIDAQLADLFERRMDAVIDINAYKRENNLPILDVKRELEILDKCARRVKNPEYAPYYKRLMKKLMELSRDRQSELNPKAEKISAAGKSIGYQGIKGAYSHLALTAVFGADADVKSYKTFGDVFAAVENGEIEYGVAPFENSFTGQVSDTLDMLYRHKCYIVKTYDLPIRHCLLGVKNAVVGDVRRVKSHPQAIMQCGDFIRAHGLAAEESLNTAVAAFEVSQRNDVSQAAIASRETAEIYGLKILAEDINTNEENTTKFIIISKTPNDGGEKFSLIFSLDHTAGRLAEAMQVIAGGGFNMDSIQSRSVHGEPWQYYFYAELHGNPNDCRAREMLERLKPCCRSLKLLGGY